MRKLQGQGFDVTFVYGFSAREPDRVGNAVGRCLDQGMAARFPIVEERVSKQDCADWCVSQGVQPSAMYCWSEHANCIGCVNGGRAYWIAVAANHPEVFAQRMGLEEEFGHEIIRGGDRDRVWLKDLVQLGLKRRVNQREKIELGACSCGD